MKALIRGEKVKLSDFTSELKLEIEVNIHAPFDIDFTCFGLDEHHQLKDDRYMIFYNQLQSPKQEIKIQNEQDGRSRFFIDLSKLPANITYLVFTATIDDSNTMKRIQSGTFLIKANNKVIMQYTFNPSDFNQEKAIIIGELYYKTLWRFATIGQGYDGGLAPLLKSFGGSIAEEEPINQHHVQSAAPVNDKKVLLEKRLEKEAPHLLDLSKKALVSLEKVGLQEHKAKVALCLDISSSMVNLYRTGKVQHLMERILALATRFDDDGAIDIFLFGKNGHSAGEATISNVNGFINELLNSYPLEGSTFYSKAITLIRKHYIGSSSQRKKPLPLDLPIYVMFVTDGDTFDRDQTTKQIVNASYEPIFWQFMAIDESQKEYFGKRRYSEFAYLEKLDTLKGRFIDNAGFFTVKDPARIDDRELYDLLMQEYPSWVKEAQNKGLLLE